MKYRLKCSCYEEIITIKGKLTNGNWKRDDNNRLIRREKCQSCFTNVRASKV